MRTYSVYTSDHFTVFTVNLQHCFMEQGKMVLQHSVVLFSVDGTWWKNDFQTYSCSSQANKVRKTSPLLQEAPGLTGNVVLNVEEHKTNKTTVERLMQQYFTTAVSFVYSNYKSVTINGYVLLFF